MVKRKKKPTEDRVLFVTIEDFESIDNAWATANWLHSFMIYPEDKDKRDKWISALKRDALENIQERKRIDFFKTFPETASHIFTESNYFAETLNKSLTGHKGITGSTGIRGSIAGEILIYLVKESSATLKSSYGEIIRRYKSNQKLLDQYYAAHRTSPKEQLGHISESLLKTIWKEYKNISHLWAAEYFMSASYQVSIFENPFHKNKPVDIQKNLKDFLEISSFFRNALIRKDKNSTGTPLIKTEGYSKIWSILGDEGHPYAPKKISLEKI